MELFAEMTRPFPAGEIRWRALRRSDDRARAEVTPYLAAWAVMGRLDETVGPAGWTVSYQPLGVSAGEAGRGGKADALGLVCTLTVELEGVTVARQGGAGCRGADGVEGALATAFCRAAAALGIGRYLEALSPAWVEVDSQGAFRPPPLSDWALPPSEQGGAPEPERCELPEEDRGEEEYGEIWDPVILFGKYKGRRLSELPDDYLGYLANKASDPQLKSAARRLLSG